jgi:release factor glutamine methyltransferase
VTRGELTSELATSLSLRHEARFIIEEVLGSRGSRPDQVVPPDDVDIARALAERRRAGEPLQYVLGHWAFRNLDLLVDPRVLIPRPETEQVVEVALGELHRLGRDAPVIVDAGTGSGAIALSLATELAARVRSAAQLWATDTSAEALVVAASNLERVRRQHEAKVVPVAFVQGSWLNPLPGHLRGGIDLIVSNPPYVGTDEWPHLPGEVQREPYAALVAGPGSDGTPGLAAVEQLLSEGWTWLSRPGAVIIEMAPHQTEAALRLARSMGYLDVRVEDDLAGRPRALVGRTR